jgi:hypothetical protein
MYTGSALIVTAFCVTVTYWRPRASSNKRMCIYTFKLPLARNHVHGSLQHD